MGGGSSSENMVLDFFQHGGHHIRVNAWTGSYCIDCGNNVAEKLKIMWIIWIITIKVDCTQFCKVEIVDTVLFCFVLESPSEYLNPMI